MSSSEDKIIRAFKERDWNEIKTSDSWKIFKIMSEFVEGFEKLARIGPCVSIFGSARTGPENEYFQLAEKIAFQLTQRGYGVITGGGPGIMEAANMGAKRGHGKSVGINIDLPFLSSQAFIVRNREYYYCPISFAWSKFDILSIKVKPGIIE